MTRPVTEHTTCRVCQHQTLMPYLDLGMQPLANALIGSEDKEPPLRAPLAIQACPECGLSQLTVVVDPNILYRDYPYTSGVNPAWKAHCQALADELLLEGKFVLEVASNDGTFLKTCASRAARVLGVEPASNFQGGYPCREAFWGADIAADPAIIGQVDYLVAQNVLGHVHDVHDFMEGVALALSPTGRAIIEVPYLLDLLKHTAFDTIYHEHLSYWTVGALRHLAAAHGLKVNGVMRLRKVHGGSIRAHFSRDRYTSVSTFRLHCQEERRTLTTDTYHAFANRVRITIERIDAEMPTHGYGAAAKATVLLNLLTNRPGVVFDDNAGKWGKRIPGTETIVGDPVGMKDCDALAILAWNWADVLMERARARGFTGRFFIPLPEPRWV